MRIVHKYMLYTTNYAKLFIQRNHLELFFVISKLPALLYMYFVTCKVKLINCLIVGLTTDKWNGKQKSRVRMSIGIHELPPFVDHINNGNMTSRQLKTLKKGSLTFFDY